MDQDSASVWDIASIIEVLRYHDASLSGRHKWELTQPLPHSGPWQHFAAAPQVGVPHRLEAVRESASDIKEELVEAPGLDRRAEFVRDVDARAASVGSAQEELQALAAVAGCVQELYFRKRRLELAVLEAAEGGVSKSAIAAAVGLNRTSVYPWLQRARAFKKKLRTDTCVTASTEGTYLTCQLCDTKFKTTNNDGVDAYPAMYRHWTTSHDWNPLKENESTAPQPDQLGGNVATGHPQMPQQDELPDTDELPQALPVPDTGEVFAQQQATAARVAVGKLSEEHSLASMGAETVAVLERFAKRADKEFGALTVHIDRKREESRLLTPILAISQEVERQTWILELVMLRAETLGIKRATIAKAADKAAPTVKRWANSARTLIEQMRAHIRAETSPDTGEDIVVCGLCATAFESNLLSHPGPAIIYLHWKTHHSDAKNNKD